MKKFAKAKVNLRVDAVHLDDDEVVSPTENLAEEASKQLDSAFSKALDLKPEEYKKLFELRFPSGELMVRGALPDMEDADYGASITTAYEIIALVKQYGFDEAYTFLKKVKTYDDIIFDSKSMETSKVVLDFERDLIRNFKHEIAESGVPCPKCKEKKVVMYPIQTRSADEPATIFYKCFNPRCENEWH